MKSGSICEEESTKSFRMQDRIYIYLAPGDTTVVKEKLGTIFVYNKYMVIINFILWGQLATSLLNKIPTF